MASVRRLPVLLDEEDGRSVEEVTPSRSTTAPPPSGVRTRGGAEIGRAGSGELPTIPFIPLSPRLPRIWNDEDEELEPTSGSERIAVEIPAKKLTSESGVVIAVRPVPLPPPPLSLLAFPPAGETPRSGAHVSSRSAQAPVASATLRTALLVVAIASITFLLTLLPALWFIYGR